MSLNLKKDEIQKKALASHYASDCYSTLCMCTGAGKTRTAILRAQDVVAKKPNAKIFLAVPTEKLRDQNWLEEFTEWGAIDIWNNNLTRACYVSFNGEKYHSSEWDLVILDEAHHITINNMSFFFNNEVKSILGLTATPPTDREKKGYLDALAPVSFNYPLQQGLKDGIVAPFSIDVIWAELDAIQNIVEAGPKSKRFKTTELKSYTFWNEAFEKNKQDILNVKADLSLYGWYENIKEEYEFKNKGQQYRDTLTNDPAKLKAIKSLEGKLAGLAGSRFRIIGSRRSIIQNALHKERIGRRFLNEVFEDDKRYLVFCGSIDQTERLLPGKTFHSRSSDDAYDAFLAEQLNILAVKDRVNEGTNIPNLNEALILQASAQELVLIQRIGRVIRVRENHTGRIYIICLKGTQDEVWLKSALKSFKDIQINYWNEKDFFESVNLNKFVA